MKYAHLSNSDKELIRELYKTQSPRQDIEQQIAGKYKVTKRSVRRWVKKLNANPRKPQRDHRILIYDIETPRLKAWVWWSGKQYVHDIIDEPKIISVSWKWVGEDNVESLSWDLQTNDDKWLVANFVDQYNKADLVVGVNNKNFDDRWLRARAMKLGYNINVYPKTIDLQKEAKRLIRVPSYSLKNLCKYFELPSQKLNHEGILMWNMIQEGTMAQKKEYMDKMVDYNIGDILATEALYFKMIPMLQHQIHMGVLDGNDKWSCPHCGTTDVEWSKTTVTQAGTVQHIMRCTKDSHQYKISHRDYINWINK